MGLLNLFYTKKIKDEVFGELEYHVSFIAKNIWKGTVNFEPVGHKIEIYLKADRSGPNEN